MNPLNRDTPRFRASSVVSVATAAYGIYCLAKPDQLAHATRRAPTEGWRTLSRYYGVRDLATSALMLGPNPCWWRAAMRIRLASDVTDAVSLAYVLRETPAVAAKAAGVAGGWGVVNALAWRWDEQR